MIEQRRPPTLAPAALICASACLAALLGACDRSDSAGRSVQTAGQRIAAVSMREKAPTRSSKRDAAVYTEAVASLKSASTDGLIGESGAANLLTARSHAGLGEIAAHAAATAERDALGTSSKVRAGLDAWLLHQSRAAALEQYDPTKQLADLDAQIKRRVEEAAKAKVAKQKLDAELAQLEAEAKSQLEKSRVERDAETALRQQAVNASATHRADLITQANARRRSSDGFDMQASLLRAQSTAKAPDARDMQGEVDRLNAQSKILADAKAELAALQKSNLDQATREKAEALTAAQGLKEAAADLSKVRATIPDLTDKASRTYGQALTSAKAVSQKADLDQDTKTTAKLAAAMYKHAQADVLAARLRGLESYADLLKTLASANPPLPDSAAYSAQSEAAAKDVEPAIEAAKKAYEDAQADYAGISAKPEVKDRLTKLAESLKRLSERNVATPAWLATTPSKSSGGASVSTGAATGAEAEVRRALEDLFAASKAGDLETAMAMITANTPEDKKVLAAIGGVASGFGKLNAACKDKFGKPFTDLMKDSGNPMLAGMAGQLGGGMGGMGLGDLDSASPDDLDIAMVDASTAKLTPKGGGESINMVKADGAWKILLELPPEAKAQLDPMMALFDPLAKLMNDLAGETKAGKYAGPNELMAALNQKIMPIMMKAMGGPAGGGGGGGRPGGG